MNEQDRRPPNNGLGHPPLLLNNGLRYSVRYYWHARMAGTLLLAS